jgi:FkbM family methyltransferase
VKLLLRYIRFYKTAFQNWRIAITKRILNIYPMFVVLNNLDIKVKIDNRRQFYMAGYLGCASLPSRMHFNFQWDEKKGEMHVKYNSREIVIKHIFEDGDFAGVFIDEEYIEIDVNNKLVIDIGASICDTPLYFYLKGAHKIIAFEPVTRVFYMGLDNILLNNLSGIIAYMNEAVGDKSGFINIENYEDFIAGGSPLRLSKNGTEIRQTTLTNILESIDSNMEGAILKLDCEGCEYALFSEVDPSLLKRLDTIVLEYHNGLQYLPNFFKNHGFKSQKIKPKTGEIGLLIAKKDVQGEI